MSYRAKVLDDAKSHVLTQRNNTYGPPDQDFQRIADMLAALGFSGPGEGPIGAHHVAMIMITLKLSRLVWSPMYADSWTDVAGYAACGFEAAMLRLGQEPAA